MKISRLFIISVMAICLMVSLGVAQEKIRTIEKADPTKDEPFAVVGSEVDGKSPDKNGRVPADGNWLRNLNLTVKNVSQRSIIHITVDLLIEPVGKMERPMRIPLVYGQVRSPKSIEKAKSDPTKVNHLLRPNETAILRIPRSVAESAMQILAEHGADVDHVKLIYDFVVFDDGTAWQEGDWMRPNLEKDIWERVDQGLSGVRHDKLENNENPAIIKAWLENAASFLYRGYGFFLPHICRQSRLGIHSALI